MEARSDKARVGRQRLDSVIDYVDRPSSADILCSTGNRHPTYLDRTSLRNLSVAGAGDDAAHPGRSCTVGTSYRCAQAAHARCGVFGWVRRETILYISAELEPRLARISRCAGRPRGLSCVDIFLLRHIDEKYTG